MSRVSAGLLMLRVRDNELEVLLVHPGGPLFAKKDAGVWTIPKGEVAEGEELFQTAEREFREETGWEASGPFHPLEAVTQRSGKRVHAWAFFGDVDTTTLKSNTFEMEWPPRSGRRQQFPEVDRAAFFKMDQAREKMNPAQTAWLDAVRALRPST